jgi:hypothetical protein
VVAGAAYAYDRTLISETSEVGGLIAPASRFTKVKETFAIMAGATGAIVVNHNWRFGAGGYWIVNEVVPEDLAELDDLRMAYGGLILEYVFRPGDVLHMCMPVLVGVGRVSFRGDYVDPETGEDSEEVFIVEPELNLELNITRNWRVSLGFVYRYVDGSDLTDFQNDDLSGMSGSVRFAFGKF